MIYAWRIEIEADSEDDARLRGEELVAHEGLGDVEGVYLSEDEDEDDD